MTRTASLTSKVARTLFTAGTLCAASSLFSACGSTPTEVGGPPEELKTLPRALTVAESRVRDAANQFSLALWSQVNGAQLNANVFLSPLSASFALGMTMNGAAGNTFEEMRRTLEFSDAELAEINDGYRSLIDLLRSLDKSVDIRVANSIWYRNGFPFRQSFLDTTKEYFDATSQGLDFANQAASLAAINGWASEATNGKIPEVLKDVSLDQVMLLINAIYFKGSWREQFDPKRTYDGLFRAANGAQQPARLMLRTAKMYYQENSAYQAVELPYGNRAFVMNVLLPKDGVDFEEFAAALPEGALVSSNYTESQIELHMPKIRLQYERKLNDDLKAMGMKDAFLEGGADFTNLSPAPTGHELFIEFVKQNTFVDINEEGTEAAAVTTIGIVPTSAPAYPIMRVDRPFVFVIRERLTGTILFMGKIVQMPA